MKTYTITAIIGDGETATDHSIDATSIGEALMIAQRSHLGSFYAIKPSDYTEATAEGINYNEADGVLL